MNNNNKNRTNEILKKRAFTSTYLQPLIKHINTDILCCHYEYTIDNEEYIYIYFDNYQNDINKPVVRKVCVTADSLKALVIDVLKHI